LRPGPSLGGPFRASLTGPYGDTLIPLDSSVRTAVNIVIDANTTTVVGGYADGNLGCTTQAGEVTSVQGRNWYAGTDPGADDSSLYDFSTVVIHEAIGHRLLSNLVPFPSGFDPRLFDSVGLEEAVKLDLVTQAPL
jgi:hypothetical protein